MFGMGLTTPIRTLLIFESVNLRALSEAERTVVETTRNIHMQAQKLLMGGAAMAVGLVAPMAFAASSIAKTSASMELLMSKIKNINQYGPNELGKLEDAFMRISKETGASPVDVAAAGYEAAQANYTKLEDLVKIATTASKISIASGWEVDAKTAADQFTRLAQAFDLPIEKSDMLAETLLRTQQIGKMSFEQILAHSGKAAANYGSLAKQAGRTPEEAIQEYFAMAASGTLAGLNADQMFTAMRGIMMRVFTETTHKPVMGKNGKMSGSYGPMNMMAMAQGYADASDMLIKLGMVGFMQKADLSTAGFTSELQKLGFRQREITAITSLMRNRMQDTLKTLKDVKQASGRLDQAWFGNLSTLQGLGVVLDATRKRFEIAFGKALKPWITGLYTVVIKLFDALAALPMWAKHVMIFAGAITALASAVMMLTGVMTWFYAQAKASALLRLAGAGSFASFEKGQGLSGHAKGAAGLLPYLLGAQFGGALTNKVRGLGSIFSGGASAKVNGAAYGAVTEAMRKAEVASLSGRGYMKRLGFAMKGAWILALAGLPLDNFYKALINRGGFHTREAVQKVIGHELEIAGRSRHVVGYRTLSGLMVPASMKLPRSQGTPVYSDWYANKRGYLKYESSVENVTSKTANAGLFGYALAKLSGGFAKVWLWIKSITPALSKLANGGAAVALAFVAAWEAVKLAWTATKDLASSLWDLIPGISGFGKMISDFFGGYTMEEFGNDVLRALNPIRLLAAALYIFRGVLNMVVGTLSFAFSLLIMGVEMCLTPFVALYEILKNLYDVSELIRGGQFATALDKIKNGFTFGNTKALKDHALTQIDEGSNALSESWDIAKDWFKKAFGMYKDQSVMSLLNPGKYNPDGTLKNALEGTAGFDSGKFTTAAVYGTSAGYNASLSVLQVIARNTDPANPAKPKAIVLQPHAIGD